MPNIYKGHNFDEMHVALGNVSPVNGDKDINWKSANDYFLNNRFGAVAFMFKLSFGYGFVADIANSTVEIKNGEINTNLINTVSNSISGITNKAKNNENVNVEKEKLAQVLGTNTGNDIGNFAAMASLAAAIFPNPVTGAIAGGLTVIASVWNLFTSPGKDASFRGQENVRAMRREYAELQKANWKQMPKPGRNLIRFYWYTYLFTKTVSDARPKGVAPTAITERDHFRYRLRTDIHISAWKGLEHLLRNHFQTFDNFKNFVDNYDSIIAGLNIKDPSGQINNYSNNNLNNTPGNKQTSGIVALGLLASIPFIGKLG